MFLDNGILIDCGVPFAKLNIHLKEIKLILLTHRHGDHLNLSTLKKLMALRPSLRVATGQHLLEILHNNRISLTQVDVLPSNQWANYGDFAIQSFELYHDVPNVGWRVKTPQARLIYATDTASIDHVSAKGYDIYLIEANYRTPDLLARIAEKRASHQFIYENRVPYTHLSEEQATAWLSEMMAAHSRYEFIHQHKDK